VLGTVNSIYSTNRFWLILNAIVSLLVGMLCAAALDQVEFFDPNDDNRVAEIAFVIASISIFLFVVTSLARIGRMINNAIFGSVESIGVGTDAADSAYRAKIEGHFGTSLSENVMSFEKFCLDEFKRDRDNHHISWLMLAISGLITLIAGLIMLYILQLSSADQKTGSAVSLIAAIGTALPALVTGILVKIWLETGKLLQKARGRLDQLHRQRIRMLFLIGRYEPSDKKDMAKLVAEANLVLRFLHIGGTEGQPDDPMAWVG
jgi:hypothetical protein